MRRMIAVLVLGFPGWVSAHPVDEVVQGAYLILGPNEVKLELDIAIGTEVAAALLPAVDPDGDGIISAAEMQAYASFVLQQLVITLDGTKATWALVDAAAPDYAMLVSGNALIKINAVVARADRSGTHVFHYLNPYQPAKTLRIANVFLQPSEGWQYKIITQDHSDDGAQMAVSYTATER